jgi:TonB family protein
MVAQRYIRVFCLVVAMVCLAGAQEPRHISNDEARRHLIKDVVPDYPKMAQGAAIHGVVELEITITDSGYVYTDPKAAKGDPILVQAALDAVKQWEFRPFIVKGKLAWVRAAILVDFSPGSVAVLLAKYLQEETECAPPLLHDRFAAAETLCEQALETATKLPQSFVREKSRAYDYAGTAAYNVGKVDVALQYFKQELSFAEQIAVPPLGVVMLMVHNNLAHAYEATGKLREADVEYTTAEKAQEALLADLENMRERLQLYMYLGMKASYEQKLRIIFEDHARALRRMGKISKAETVEQRAAALAESN